MKTIPLDEALAFVLNLTQGDLNHKRWVTNELYKAFDEDAFLAHIKSYDENYYKMELQARRPDQYAIEYPPPPPADGVNGDEVI